jgi:hypothetical protein
MDGPAPSLDTVRKATLQENSKAFSIDISSAKATANAPVNESPAPVVSTSLTPLC